MEESRTALLFFTNEKNIVPLADLGDRPTSGTVYSLVVLASALAKCGVHVCIACGLAESREADGVFYEPCHDEARLIELSQARYYERVVVVGHAVNDLSDAVREVERCDYWLHNWTPYPELVAQIARFQFRQIICVSRYHLGYYLVQSLRQPGLLSRLAYVDNPVDARFFNSNVNRSLEVAEAIEVAFIGYPSRGKGFDLVVDMMEALSQLTERRCVLHVFGDAKLYNQADEAELDIPAYDPVVLHGSVSRKQLYPMLARCQFAVSGLSGSETFCLSLLEAGACGVVPVTINSGGQVSFLNLKNAIIAECVADLPQRVLDCFENRQHYEALASQARELHLQFTPELIAQRWLELDTQRTGRSVRLEALRVFVWFVFTRLLRAWHTFLK